MAGGAALCGMTMATPSLPDLPPDLLARAVVGCMGFGDVASAACACRALCAAATTARLEAAGRRGCWKGAVLAVPPEAPASAVAARVVQQASAAAAPSLALIFGTPAYEAHLGAVGYSLAARLPPTCAVVGCAAQGVVATDTATGATTEFLGGRHDALCAALVSLPPGARALPFTEATVADVLAASNDGDDEEVFALLLSDDSHAMLRTGRAIRERRPNAVVVGGLAHGEEPLVCLAGGKAPSGATATSGCVGVVVTGAEGSARVRPVVTRGATPFGAKFGVGEKTCDRRRMCPGHRRTETWLKTLVREGTEDRSECVTRPLVVLTELAEQHGGLPRPLYVGVRSGGERRWSLLEVSRIDDSDGSIAVAGEVPDEEAEVSFCTLTPKGSDAEVVDGCEEATTTSLSSVLGVIVVSCCGRGAHFHGDHGRETRALRAALDGTPVIGFFANGEYGPTPHGEKGGEDLRTSELMGFTGVFGLVGTPKE